MATNTSEIRHTLDAPGRAGGGAPTPSAPSPSVGAYAGDIDSRAAFGVLASTPTAVLLDVRTAPEWEYVGRPDLSGLDRGTDDHAGPILVSWKHWPGEARSPSTGLAPNTHFVEEVRSAGVRPDQTVLLLCRSGQRSRDAAVALTNAGYTRCFNISDGFEGTKDASGHRGTVDGWRKAGLPWIQG